MNLVEITIKPLNEIVKMSVIEDGDYEMKNNKEVYYSSVVEDLLNEDRTLVVDADADTKFGFYVPEEIYGTDVDYDFIPNECVSYIDNLNLTLKEYNEDKIVFDCEQIESFQEQMEEEGHRHFVRNLEESGYSSRTIDRILDLM